MLSQANTSSKTYPKENICPKCKKLKSEERVPRGILVKYFLFWMPLRRYRCNNCQKKMYRRVPEHKAIASKQIN